MTAQPSTPVVLGVDGGTESLRAGIFDLKGTLLTSFASPYETQYPHPGWAEQRPADWWAALGIAVRGVVKAAEDIGIPASAIAAMCVDTTCCTVVALGPDGHALRPALLWSDMRSASQAEKVAACGDPALRVNAGGGSAPPRVSAEWMIPKALWLRENERQTYAAADTICEYQDYINFHLTGRMVASVTNMAVRWHGSRSTIAPTSQADPASKQRSSISHIRGPRPEVPYSLLAALDMSSLAVTWPAQVRNLGEVVGRLTESAAKHLGLREGLPVAQGGADAYVGMLGLGVCQAGQLALLTGSSHLQLGFVATELHGRGVFGTYADAVLPGLHVIEGGQTSTGSIINWFKKNLCAADVSYDTLNEEAAAVPAGCEGLLALDHFQGNRTPHTDPLSRGALVGLTLKHGRGHIFRALMEAVAFGNAHILETMAAAGYTPHSIAVAGGATRSELWLQMHADVCGLPLLLTKVPDAPMLGCAVLASVAAGLHTDIPSAIHDMVHVSRIIRPDPVAHAAYKPHYENYKRLYPAVAPLFQGPAKAAIPMSNAGGRSKAAASPSKSATSTPRSPATQTTPPPPGHLAVQAATLSPNPSLSDITSTPPPTTATTTPSMSPVQPTVDKTATPASATSGQPAAVNAYVGGDVSTPQEPAIAAPVGEQCAVMTPASVAPVAGLSSPAEGATAASPPAAAPYPARDSPAVGTPSSASKGRPPLILAPSILAADFADLAKDVAIVVEAGAAWVHVDMFDGTYCDNFTIGPPVLASLRRRTAAYLDCHAAVQNPAKYIGAIAAAGANGFTFHIEVMPSIKAAAQLAQRARALGMQPGIALAPDTPLSSVLPLVEGGDVDLVLCMTVTPGFGGQKFQTQVLRKVMALRAQYPSLNIQVDGGVNRSTAAAAVGAGANILVAGTAVFDAPGGAGQGVKNMLSMIRASQ